VELDLPAELFEPHENWPPFTDDDVERFVEILG
jgi:hypothetical protein